MLKRAILVGSLAASLVSGVFAQTSWDPKAAANYLDSRAQWWSTWPNAARDHQTFCISCHTALPYAAARASLRHALGETRPSPIEQKMVDNVSARVRMWDQVAPYYPNKNETDTKTTESRGTEAILNAFVLTSYGSAADTDRALDQMWALQLSDGDAKGAFPWLQFHNAPWEGDSQYFGATLAALAAGRGAAARGLESLKEYLRKDYASRTLIDRVMLLWASTRVHGLLSAAERDSIVAAALSRQQTDGGFSLSSFVGDWKRKDNTPLETRSDGYATGMVAFVLQEAGVPGSDSHIKASLAWLEKNQQAADGRWLAYSLNKQRDLGTDIGKFMSDAATAYAVLALSRSN
jgi:squalene-hopene/tetraprenyl-beta-curcumene cyclase